MSDTERVEAPGQGHAVDTEARAIPIRLPRFMAAYRRLDELATLPADWDSYGGAVPSPASLRAARGVLKMLDQQFGQVLGVESVPSHIAPLPSGGIQMEWTGSSKDIEVESDDEGTFAYLIVDRSHNERRFIEEDDVPAATVVEVIVGVLLS